MFELWYIAIGLVGLSICGIWDLLTSNVPDKICFLMISLGVGLHGLESYLTGSYTSLFYSFTAGGLFLFYGLIMYYAGQWGGGDGEMLVVVGFLLPVSSVQTLFPFALSYFINFAIISVLFSLLYLVYLMKAPGIKRNGLEFYRRIPTSKLKKDDVIGENFPKLGLYKKKIKGLTEMEVRKIRKHKRYILVKEGIRSGIVFPVTLAITLYFGDLILFLVR